MAAKAGDPVYPFVATQIYRQLCRSRRILNALSPVMAPATSDGSTSPEAISCLLGTSAAVQSSALECHQPFVADRAHVRAQPLDLLACVDSHADERKIFGEGQQPVAAKTVLGSEPLHSSQENAAADLVASVDVQQLIGQQYAF